MSWEDWFNCHASTAFLAILIVLGLMFVADLIVRLT